MVLTPRRCRSTGALITSGLVLATVAAPRALAQRMDTVASAIEPPAAEYQPQGVRIGPVLAYPKFDVGVLYDDNIYTRETNKIDDAKLIVAPEVSATYDGGNVVVNGRAHAEFRRFFSQTSENSTAAGASSRVAWRPSGLDQLAAEGGWERVVEDRGDPEARNFIGSGPRLIDAYTSELDYRHDGTRIGYGLRGSVARFDNVAAIDAERDFTAYSLVGRGTYRLSGTTSLLVSPFYTLRNFSLPTDSSGVDRDSTSYGARAGVALDPGGVLHGEAAVGMFRFDPEDPTLKGRTGLSVQASLIYQPDERLAITLDAFRGDVVTVRIGASTRVDTRFQLGIQQEARHNLRWQSAIIYRKSKYIGGTDERTLGGLFEAEYLVNRYIGIAASLRYSDRNSALPGEDFERFRAGLTLRLHL